MKPQYAIFQRIVTATLSLAPVALQDPPLWGAEKEKQMKVPPNSESSEADALQLIKDCLIENCFYSNSVVEPKKQEEMRRLR
tara:strand:+ start:3263 stop:3508 length:246 start_codon:yes stop_codon:yes gene_type:complete